MLQVENTLVYEAWYPVKMIRRYSEVSPHPQLNILFTMMLPKAFEYIEIINNYAPLFKKISVEAEDNIAPFWNNGYLPLLDSMSLYAFLAEKKPETYVEIGSGNSTKFARQSIYDNALPTKILSIDPCPRSDVATLCDISVRKGLEDVDVSMFDQLKSGDVVFFDGSHRVMQNSDCVAFFLDVLPRLVPGVLVGIHDIMLPYDYFDQIVRRYYNEQYFLAGIILFSKKFEVILPSYFASCQHETSTVMNMHNPAPSLGRVSGCTFWMRTVE